MVLDPLKEILDNVPLLVRRSAVGFWMFAVTPERDAGQNASRAQPVAERIAIITFFRDDHGRGNPFEHGLRMANLGFVARAQQAFGHMASRIDHRVTG